MLSTAVVMFIGITCFSYYLLSEITYGSVIVGFIGFVLVLSPAWDKWKKYFDRIYWKRKENN
jgi:hypothetical protein